MPPSSGSRRSNSRSHGGGSFRSRSGSRSTSRSSSQLRWVPKVPPVPEEGGATASRDTPAPTQQSWADQGGHVNYWQNKSADPIQQANWTGQGQDFPIPPPSDTGGTGPEAPPPPWAGEGPEPSKRNRADVLEATPGRNCPICHKFIRGGRWQLRCHQLTSSRCLAASGQAVAATEPCRHCGKTLAAGDAWALTQHSQHCPGQTSRGRSEEPGAASASGRHSSSRRPRAKDRSASRGRRQAQREPDWNDPATYFHRDPWEYAHIRDEDEAFRAWLEGSSQPSSGFATTNQDNGGANHEADQRYHGDQIQSTDTSWRDWSREEWDRYPHDPALWRERGWQDWSQSEPEPNSSRYHAEAEALAVIAWRDHMWRRTSNSQERWRDNNWQPHRHQETEGWTSWRDGAGNNWQPHRHQETEGWTSWHYGQETEG